MPPKNKQPVIDLSDTRADLGLFQGEPTQIMEAMGRLGDIHLRADLEDFVREYDMRRLESFNDLADGFQGLFKLALFLGPMSGSIRRTIEVAAKILKDFADQKRAYLSIDFPKEIEDTIRAEHEKLLGALEQVLPNELWVEIRRVMSQYVEKDV